METIENANNIGTNYVKIDDVGDDTVKKFKDQGVQTVQEK